MRNVMVCTEFTEEYQFYPRKHTEGMSSRDTAWLPGLVATMPLRCGLLGVSVMTGSGCGGRALKQECATELRDMVSLTRVRDGHMGHPRKQSGTIELQFRVSHV